MSNIIDTIQVSGTTYQIQGSGGGVPENVFTAYTASTDSRIGEDEEVTAAALNALDEKIDSISGGGTVDQTIISGSTNAVAGGAVYNKIDEVEQVTAAGLNAVNDKFDGLKLKKLTQSQYDALSGNTDSNTLYVIVN